MAYARKSEAEWKQVQADNAALKARFTAPIVCICGSTKFKQSWIAENARLTGEGNIVLAVGLWGHHERVFPDPETKAKLDDLHKRKIDLCDWVWVLDIGGYIGESTRSEIEYAEKLGRPVRYLSQEFPGYVEPIDPVAAERDAALARAEKAEARALPEDIKPLVDRFLSWPVPASVYPDGTPGQPGRTGTNLLSAVEARQMLEYVLALQPAQPGLPRVTCHVCKGEEWKHQVCWNCNGSGTEPAPKEDGNG